MSNNIQIFDMYVQVHNSYCKSYKAVSNEGSHELWRDYRAVLSSYGYSNPDEFGKKCDLFLGKWGV